MSCVKQCFITIMEALISTRDTPHRVPDSLLVHQGNPLLNSVLSRKATFFMLLALFPRFIPGFLRTPGGSGGAAGSGGVTSGRVTNADLDLRSGL